MTMFSIPIQDLMTHVNPMDGSMWRCRPIEEKEVRAAVNAGVVESRVWNNVVNSLDEEDARLFHINRIASLVNQQSDERIVVIAENHQSPIRVYLHDGNHRLAAAYVRGDTHIIAVVACSTQEWFVTDIFPGAVPL